MTTIIQAVSRSASILVLCALAAAYFWYRLPKFGVLIRPTYRRLGIIPDEPPN